MTVTKVMGGYREEAFINAIQSGSEQFQIVNEQVQAWQNAIKQDADEANRAAELISYNSFWVFTLTIVIATLFDRRFRLSSRHG